MLNFSEEMNGYVVNMSKADLEKAPTYELNDLTKNDGRGQMPALDYYAKFVGQVSIPRQSRGLYDLSRSKRQKGSLTRPLQD